VRTFTLPTLCVQRIDCQPQRGFDLAFAFMFICVPVMTACMVFTGYVANDFLFCFPMMLRYWLADDILFVVHHVTLVLTWVSFATGKIISTTIAGARTRFRGRMASGNRRLSDPTGLGTSVQRWRGQGDAGSSILLLLLHAPTFDLDSWGHLFAVPTMLTEMTAPLVLASWCLKEFRLTKHVAFTVVGIALLVAW